MRWVKDPISARARSRHRCVRRIDRRRGRSRQGAIEAALSSGKSVVTANKALLAKHGVKLAALAEKNHVALNFEAAVAGGIPIVKTLREGLVGNKLARIYGILNGTCNYILTRMEQEGLSFADCLKDAQRLGYAEADPTFDIEGHDTAQKLSILASLAFGIKVDPASIFVEGISSIAPEDLSWAEELGYRIKLLGVAVDTGTGHRAARAPDHGAEGFRDRAGDGRDQRRDRRCRCGRTRSRWSAPARAAWRRLPRWSRTSATSRAACARRRSGAPTKSLATSRKAPMQRHEGGYYIRLLARDRPGTAATIARRLAQQGISLESIVQRHSGARPRAVTSRTRRPGRFLSF